jgi:hypothetical protein
MLHHPVQVQAPQDITSHASSVHQEQEQQQQQQQQEVPMPMQLLLPQPMQVDAAHVNAEALRVEAGLQDMDQEVQPPVLIEPAAGVDGNDNYLPAQDVGVGQPPAATEAAVVEAIEAAVHADLYFFDLEPPRLQYLQDQPQQRNVLAVPSGCVLRRGARRLLGMAACTVATWLGSGMPMG